MVSKNITIEFMLSSPIILTDDLHFDAVLLAVATQQGIPFETAIRDLPMVRQDGIPRCSRMLWDGLPKKLSVEIIRNIWTTRELDGHAYHTEKGFLSSHRKAYKAVMDMHIAQQLPVVRFVVETTHAEKLQEWVRSITALGKWARKGYGRIAAFSLRESPDADPWILPSGYPARTLPVTLWNQYSGNGPHALKMAVANAPYWGKERAQLCAVEKL